MNTWKTIWNNEDRIKDLILDLLIKADGFDTTLSHFNTKEWVGYTKDLYTFAGIKDGQSIFEVGCGAGAFLFPLKDTNQISGLDFSEVLIDIAQKFLGNTFYIGDALEGKYTKSDITLSNGAFIYFKDFEYSKKVLQKMMENSDKIAIFDINNIDKKHDYYTTRAAIIGEGYQEKYTKTEHLFYTKEFFREFAEEFNLKVSFMDQPKLENYPSAEYRFNVKLEK
jgi:ubiquinone/menaquinone biosynthesis C-methylase UbiE